jgi:hypothetical protein
MNVVRTLAPTPARLWRRFVAALHVGYLRVGLKAAQDDIEAYRQQVEYANTRRSKAERHAACLQRRIDAIR